MHMLFKMTICRIVLYFVNKWGTYFPMNSIQQTTAIPYELYIFNLFKELYSWNARQYMMSVMFAAKSKEKDSGCSFAYRHHHCMSSKVDNTYMSYPVNSMAWSNLGIMGVTFVHTWKSSMTGSVWTWSRGSPGSFRFSVHGDPLLLYRNQKIVL